MDTLAEAYCAAGKYRKAVRWEREALKLEPNNTFFKGQLKKFKAAR
jgi:cytochrome c-type biogenesis protein CcmH/NrfG